MTQDENGFIHSRLSNVYPPAFPHNTIAQIFENIYLVHGSIRIGPGMRMNRNMVIIEDSGELTLINPVRLNEKELTKLEALGTVRHIMRLGDFHGLDDQFYVDRYQAEFWCQPGQTTYQNPLPNHIITSDTAPPISDAEFFVFESASFPEAALLLKESKLLITTDSVQYWPDWEHTSVITRLVLWLMGFRLTLFIGGPWLKRVSPRNSSLLPDFERLMALDFEHVVAAHGKLLRNQAKPLLQEAIEKAFGSATKSLPRAQSACG